MTAHDGRFFLTPAEIYHQLTEGDGDSRLRDEQAQTQDEMMNERDRADLVRSLANLIQAGWQGTASAGAYGAAMPLAERMLENSEKLNRSQDLLARQVDSFRTAYNSVQPISDPPKGSIDETFPFDVDHEKAVKEYQDAAQNNIAVFRTYDGASHYNETNLPQEYHTTERTGGEVGVDAPGDVIKVGDPGPGEPRSGGPGPGYGPGGQFTGTPYVGGYSGEPGPGPFEPGGTRGSGGQTSPNEYRPLSGAGSPLPTYPQPGQPSPVSGGPGFVGGGYPVGGGFGPRGGSGEPGPVRGGGGPAGGAGAGSRVGAGPGGARGFGPGAGTGAGALAAEEAAARRAAAGARPGSAAPAGAPVGAGRGKDDEDAEHQRKVLMEVDAEAVFGSDVLTAPQVIGDDEYED